MRRRRALALLVLLACSRPKMVETGMTNDDLISELRRESLAGRTRADSASLLRAIEVGPALVPALARELERAAPPYHAYYLLAEAVRELDPASFARLDQSGELRIYVEALRHATVFNDWGFPGATRPARGDWLKRFGPAALRELAPLLDDRRLAPLLGSQDATLARARQNRVCDYALFLSFDVQGDATVYPALPAERDELIRAFKARSAAAPAGAQTALTDDALLAALLSDAAAGRSSPESAAFGAALGRGGALVPKLLESLRATGTEHRFLVLEAVRQLSPADYRTLDVTARARIYAEALRVTRRFDDFGLPEQPSETGRAVVELGRAAEGALRPLLDDDREVAALDGELNTMLRARHVRVCDYALYFTLAIRRDEREFPKNPEERDRLIAALRREGP